MPSRNTLFESVPSIITTKRRCRRRPGEIPYPVQYSNRLADFDIWDHMFLTNYFRGLAIHQFPTPPSVVLDLGCGTGYWVIEAAKQWKDSKFYGFDVAKIQPRLEEMDHYKSLAQRIEWVHGNFLDGLPFKSDYFNFVRIAGLGLAIPEDEWQTVLEEVHRIMRPGAVLEIIEEDLLFPCSSALLQSPRPSSPSTPTDHLGSGALELHKSKSTTFYDRSSRSPERRPLLPTLGSVYHRTRLTSRASILPPPASVAEQSSTSTSTLIASTDTISETEHPQDHSRLKTAWDAMLDTRFLSPSLLSVLPFYLTSSGFVETKVQSPLVITLPSNSGNVPTLKTYRSMGSIRLKPERSLADTLFEFPPALSSQAIKTDGFAFWSSVFSLHQPSTQGRGGMHLAKTVSTIRGCKETIWEEYKKLYSSDALSVLSRTAPDEEDYKSQPHKHVVRKAFEVDWKNWELDMIDRMAMQNILSVHMGWVPAIPDSDRDGPDWRTWREKLDRKSGSENNIGHLITGFNPDDLCRSLRVFTGSKP